MAGLLEGQAAVVSALDRHSGGVTTTLRADSDGSAYLLVDGEDLCAVIDVGYDPAPEHDLVDSLATA